MNMYGSLVSPGCILNEQVARQVFDILPEGGPIMVIMDREGNCWPSNSEEFSKLNISESFIRELCAKIDDGTEPVITHTNDSSIIAAQLATEQTNCGYVIVALPQYNPESTMANINLIETILSQTSLIARLIEKNNLLYELHNKRSSLHDRGETASK
jgi:Trk K+ transport system NAD-binding subunit